MQLRRQSRKAKGMKGEQKIRACRYKRKSYDAATGDSYERLAPDGMTFSSRRVDRGGFTTLPLFVLLLADG